MVQYQWVILTIPTSRSTHIAVRSGKYSPPPSLFSPQIPHRNLIGRGQIRWFGRPRSGSGSSAVDSISRGGEVCDVSAPVANIVIPFALTPACAVSEVIDYTMITCINLYAKVVAHLENSFDMEASSLKIFLAQIYVCACEANWYNIINIDDSSGDSLNIFTHYG